MINYAGKVENGIVVQAIVGTAQWATENLGGEWYDSPKKIPIPGLWDLEHSFRPLQPFPSWIWDGSTWQPPVPYPDDEQIYQWNETTISWELVEEQ